MSREICESKGQGRVLTVNDCNLQPQISRRNLCTGTNGGMDMSNQDSLTTKYETNKYIKNGAKDIAVAA